MGRPRKNERKAPTRSAKTQGWLWSGRKLTPSEEPQARVLRSGCRARPLLDQEGHAFVDKNGKRKKNKKGQFVRFHPGMEEQFGVKKNGNKKSQKRALPPRTNEKAPRNRGRLRKMRFYAPSSTSLVTKGRGRCVWRFGELKRLVPPSGIVSMALSAAHEGRWNWRMIQKLSLRSTWTKVPHASSCRDRYRWEDETARSHFQAVAHSCSSYAKIRRAALRERVGMDPQKRIKPHQELEGLHEDVSIEIAGRVGAHIYR